MQKDTGNSGIGFFGVLAILFITLKLLNIISWSWLWVLAPIWLPIIVVTGLLGIVWLIGFFGVLAILFITLKLLNIISWSWLWVLAPIWLPIIVVTGLLGIVWLTIHIKDRCS